MRKIVRQKLERRCSHAKRTDESQLLERSEKAGDGRISSPCPISPRRHIKLKEIQWWTIERVICIVKLMSGSQPATEVAPRNNLKEQSSNSGFVRTRRWRCSAMQTLHPPRFQNSEFRAESVSVGLARKSGLASTYIWFVHKISELNGLNRSVDAGKMPRK